MVWWSDSFGVLVMLLMSEGLVEKVRSRILSPLVGSSWSCVRPWLREISTSFSCTFLLAAPWATWQDSQFTPGQLKSPQRTMWRWQFLLTAFREALEKLH